MKDERERLGVDGDLVRDFVLLVIQEVLQHLFFLRLVVSLAHEALRTTHFIFPKDCSSNNLLQNKFIFGVFELVVDLPKLQAR